MRKAARLLLVVWVVMLWVGMAAPARALEPGGVVVLTGQGVVDAIMTQYIQRGIRAADDANAVLVVIELDTPGGLDNAMRGIVQAILNADVPVVVYVAPAGARAASAGVFITMAAHTAAMAYGTNIGAATPVSADGTEMTATMQDKVTNDAVSYIRAIAQERGRNADWAEAAVRQAASLTAEEAQAQNVVDLLANSLPDLLAQLNGRTVQLDGRTVTLRLETATVERLPMTLLEQVAHRLIDPNIAFILLSLGTLALMAELFNPGAVLPGVTGLIALVIAFVALGNLPVNWGGVLLMLLAFAFFILDIKVTGFVLSVAGVVSFLVGALLLFSPFTPSSPTMPRLAVHPLVLGSMTVAVVAFFGLVLRAAVRAHQRAALMGGVRQTIGQQGVAVTALNPAGVVQVRQESWTAVAADGPIEAGQPVEVISSDGLHLRVRRVDSIKEG